MKEKRGKETSAPFKYLSWALMADGERNQERVGAFHTVNRLALRQVVVVLAGQEGVTVSAHDAFDKPRRGHVGASAFGSSQAIFSINSPVVDIVEQALHLARHFLRQLQSSTFICSVALQKYS
jgi:hypothetical protein